MNYNAATNNSSDALQFRVHKLFVPRYEAQLARVHALIERAEAGETLLLQVLI